MLFYSIVILAALYFFHVSVKLYDRSRLYLIPYTLFLVIVITVGGVRDITVGKDLAGYGIRFWDDSRYFHSLTDIFSYAGGEYLYHVVNFISRIFSDDIHMMFFTQELIKSVLAGSAALYFRKRIDATMFMFFYLTFFYIHGFSCMRQNIAICIFMFGLRYFFEARWLKYFICVAIAYFFHRSALFAVVPVGILILYQMKIKMYLQVVIILVVFALSYKIMDLLSVYDTIFGEGKAEAYAYIKSGIRFPKTNMLMNVAYLASAIIFRRNLSPDEDNKRWLYFYVCSCLYSAFLIFMSEYFEVAFRVSWYFMIMMMIQFLEYTKAVKNPLLRKSLFVMNVALLILNLAVSASRGASGCIPYTSKILGI